MINSEDRPAICKLILEDGTEFCGKSFGAEMPTAGEVVFNTGMVGYPESFTDPSYAGQILVLTYPLIGNYGIPLIKKEGGVRKYFESEKIHIKGLVVSEYSKKHNHWQAENSLGNWLKKNNIAAIEGIDTRALTKKLRTKGVMLGKIIAGNGDVEFYNPNNELLAKTVSTKKIVTYKAGKKSVALIDMGVKNNIIRSFLKRGVTVVRIPWDYDFCKIKSSGIFISNGPGDPKTCKITIDNIKKYLSKNKPTFGICFGNQLLALAAGGDTYKLKFGHRSQNQPCVESGTRRCYITSQNHGYAVNAKKLPAGWKEWFYNANDNTNEGIKHKTKPFMSVQFHPEAMPGPTDTDFLFDEFIKMLK
ncbi:carbamoyl-phosphate synthase (glutamine-hydrolyzing) small subunit [Candidatus Parcubacteria bacterium]|nr:MAG: carbamoyl-phosphate synthase (glutamine-hydrolyzing) small subunit [Candidatus Parcubacteria bacterium]